MAIPWLVALKVIPWGDVIEHAPKVLSAARKLMDRQRAEPPPPAAPATDRVGESPPSLGELRVRLTAAQAQIDQQAQTQEQLARTLAELAEQNARLVSAVDVLRVRSRLLLWGVGLLAICTAWLAWR